MSNSQLLFIIGAAYAGERLDKALQEFFPTHSLRARKALWDDYDIYVRGRRAKAGHIAMLGDEIRFVPRSAAAMQADIWEKLHSPHFITSYEDWLFFNKPRGLHSQEIRGGGYSFEQWLKQHEERYGKLILCNRLDAETSGILVTARTSEAMKKWLWLENNGHCQKRYVALVQGDVVQLSMPFALDTHKRKITKVLEEEAAAVRHSHFFPLRRLGVEEYARLCDYFSSFPEQKDAETHFPENISLLGCIIHKGARHQIRAHAAKAGFALYNDTRYREHSIPERECFLLHHGGLSVDDVSVHCPLPYADALDCGAAIEEFFFSRL